MSVKRAFFGVFQKLTLFCCAIFFGITNTFAANLPSGYTELEYIKSSDNAFLDTGYILQSDDIKYEWNAIDAAGSSSSLFGSETNTTPKYSGILHGSPSTRTLYVGNSTGLGVGYTTDTTSFHSWVLDITSAGKASLYKDGTKTATANWTVPVQKSLSIYIFSNHSKSQYANNVSLKYFKITDNNELKVNLVPAQRDSDGKVGMYDLVSNQFITNSQGSLIAGPVVLNPCRNLFDGEYISVSSGQKAENKNPFYVTPGKKYTISWSGSTPVAVNLYAYDSNNTVLYSWTSSSGTAPYFSDSHNAWYNGATFTVPENVVRLRFNTFGSMSAAAQASWAASLQIEEGSTATTYVPYSASCHNTNAIKIATTAYNAARFNPVVTDLNSTIATIRSVVTNTINQTKAIADLQAKKQTRPDEQCPAGKKCLLVETEENGVVVPHWFPIIETPEE